MRQYSIFGIAFRTGMPDAPNWSSLVMVQGREPRGTGEFQGLRWQLSWMVLLTVIALCESLWTCAATAGTVVVPGLPAPPPAVGFPTFSALRVNTNGFATAFSAGFPPASDSFSELKTEFVEPGEFDTFLNVHKAVNVTSGELLSSAVGAANAGFGKLGASATALTSIHLGIVSAQVSVNVEFIDVLEIAPGDVVNLNGVWNVDGTATSHAAGTAAGLGQVWIFPFGPFPNPLGQFQAHFYKSVHNVAGATPLVTLLGSLNDLAPGSKYWIYGRLEVFANRNQTGTSIADFFNTAQLFIDPAPGTPAGAYTTASRFDYRTPPVPEPMTATLGLLNLIALSLMLGRRRHSLAHKGEG